MARPGSKTDFVVAKLYVQFYTTVVLGCVDDSITNITQKCIKLRIPWIYGSSKCFLPHENPGSKWENMVAFATKIPQISSPGNDRRWRCETHSVGTQWQSVGKPHDPIFTVSDELSLESPIKWQYMCYYNPLHRSRRAINQYFRLTDQNAKLFTRNHDMCFAKKSARMLPGCSHWSIACGVI